MKPNIILIGFPKSLKTQTAKYYSRTCKRSFLDMKSHINKSNLRYKNKFIAQKYTLRKFAKLEDHVLTISSGIISNKEVEKKLKGNIFIYLRRPDAAEQDPKLDAVYKSYAKLEVEVPEYGEDDYKEIAKKLARSINEGLDRF